MSARDDYQYLAWRAGSTGTRHQGHTPALYSERLLLNQLLDDVDERRAEIEALRALVDEYERPAREHAENMGRIQNMVKAACLRGSHSVTHSRYDAMDGSRTVVCSSCGEDVTNKRNWLD